MSVCVYVMIYSSYTETETSTVLSSFSNRRYVHVCEDIVCACVYNIMHHNYIDITVILCNALL